MQPPATHNFRKPLRRRGFSFTEILFAVMILGIGFIMVVAIFPVALQQTENSQAETVGAAVARSSVRFVSQAANSTYFFDPNSMTAGTPAPPTTGFSILRPTFTGIPAYNFYASAQTGSPVALPAAPASSYPDLIGEVWSFDKDVIPDLGPDVKILNGFTLSTTQTWRSIAWPMMAQNMINNADPRYAWVALYRRDLVQTSVTTSPQYAYSTSAQVIIIALKSQAKQFYDQSDLLMTPNSTTPPQSIQPSLGNATIVPPTAVSSLNYTIRFLDPILKRRAAEGAFVVISTDGLSPGAAYAGVMNGHIYRLGTQVSGTTDTWEFAPGFSPIAGTAEAAFSIGNSRTYQVYMVGKALDPNDSSNQNYAGLAQDVAAYSTFITCPPN